MSKSSIFGEEYFIDTTMINLVEQRNNAIDNYVFEQMENTIKGTLFVEMPQVEIDKEKLKKWVILCMKLENIEQSELVDMATKKKIADLEAKLAESENTACKHIAELTRIATEKDKQIEQLKQQLAEKEKEISVLKSQLCLSSISQSIDQDKISFCVEQLEKVLKHFIYCGNEIVSDYCLDCEIDELKAELDDQIEQLKEGK